jgi:hypothetical protein
MSRLIGGDRPALGRFIVASGRSSRLELDILAQIKSMSTSQMCAPSGQFGPSTSPSLSTFSRAFFLACDLEQRPA